MIVITDRRRPGDAPGTGPQVVSGNLAVELARSGEDVVLLRSASTVGRLLWLLRHRRSITAVIDCGDPVPCLAPLAVRGSTPVVAVIHRVDAQRFDERLPWPLAALRRRAEALLARAVYGHRAVVAASAETAVAARRDLGLHGAIAVAEPGWTVTESVRTAPRPRSEHPSIVCVGSLEPHRGLDVLIEALPAVLRAYPDLTLTVVGRGPQARQLHDLAAFGPVSHAVYFREDLDDATRDALVSSAWLAVNTSRAPGWGISDREAESLGVPLLARGGVGSPAGSRAGARAVSRADEVARLARSVSETLGALAVQRARVDAVRPASWRDLGVVVRRAIDAERTRLAGERVAGQVAEQPL